MNKYIKNRQKDKEIADALDDEENNLMVLNI